MPTKPTMRSLEHLRKNGWTCCVVERWKPAYDREKRELRPYGVRVDALGFGDILACRGVKICECGFKGEIALVQTTDHTSFSKRKEKTLSLDEFHKWKGAGGMVFVHGWRLGPKDGVRGARKVWILREEVL